MSGLNVPLGYFLSTVAFAVLVRILLMKWPRFSFITDFASAFMLVACRMEVQTITDVGGWAGGLGPDVTVTILFVVLLTHGMVCGDATGNPNMVLLKFLQLETTAVAALLAILAQFGGAHLGLRVAEYYWSLELTDMHMIKNLMAAACSTSLLVSLLQGFFTESVCALVFHLIHLNLRRVHILIRVPLIAALLTFFSYAGKVLVWPLGFFCLCRHKRFEENTPLERYPCTPSPGLGVFLHRPIVEKLLLLITDRDKIKKVFFGPSMTSSMFAVVWFYAWKRKKLEAMFICLLYILSTGLCSFNVLGELHSASNNDKHTFLFVHLSAASGHTSAYVNPSLAYGLTFHCSGFTFSEYALVYWLGSLTGKVPSSEMYTLHLISSL